MELKKTTEPANSFLHIMEASSQFSGSIGILISQKGDIVVNWTQFGEIAVICFICICFLLLCFCCAGGGQGDGILDETQINKVVDVLRAINNRKKEGRKLPCLTYHFSAHEVICFDFFYLVS
jgi:hypothetical protein